MNKTQLAIQLIDLLLNLFLLKDEMEEKKKKEQLEKDKKKIEEDPMDYFNNRYGRKK